MAITTLAGVNSGLTQPTSFAKAGTGAQNAAFYWFSPFYRGGIPAAASVPSPGLSGAALTSYSGQIPVPEASNNTYLAEMIATSDASEGMLLLCDRLWHNSGVSVASTGVQTINSVTFPARDKNGSTNGEGVFVGIEFSSGLTGANLPTYTMTYTNSAGTGSRTATNIDASGALAQGTFLQMGLQAGDLGVRSIQSIQLSSTYSVGTLSMVAYRILAAIETRGRSRNSLLDAVCCNFPRLYDNTVPFMLFGASGTAVSDIFGAFKFTQG